MRLDSERLPQHLVATLAPLYAIVGAEPLLAIEAADRLRQAARRAGYYEREVFNIEARFDWAQLAASARSQSLFAEKKLIELRIVSGKPGLEGGRTIENHSQSVTAATLTLVILPGLDRAAMASKWFSSLDANGVVVSANPVPRERLPQWIKSRLALQAQTVDTPTLEFLADLFEGNLLAAFQEVQKLALLFPAGKLEYPAVKDAVMDVARYDVFKLGEAMLSRDARRLARTLAGLRDEGEAAPLVLWAMAEELRALYRIKTGLGRGQPLAQLLRDHRVWGARQNLVQQALPGLSIGQLAAALAHAARLDRMIKGLDPGDVWDEFLQLGLRLGQNAGAVPALA
jgi:DNA polymerase III subunit delta